MSNTLNERSGQATRREQWYAGVREKIHDFVNLDGTGKLAQFNAPYREPVWILPALYSGTRQHIELANRMVAQFHVGGPIQTSDTGERSGKMFNIFQTNCFCTLYNHYRHLLTPEAEEVMLWHSEQALRTFAGSAQPDFVFRGGNDNMPAHATCGLVMAGQALGDNNAIEHARWNLRQLRQLFARNAWISEFNSPVYSAITLTCMATIAEHALDEEIRDLALGIEHRLWAEILLHYHPGTMHHAGPMSRAHAPDIAGFNHSIPVVMWLAFGAEVTGRDVLSTFFNPDEVEVAAFGGYFARMGVAELTSFVAADLHVPKELAHLASVRQYPAILRGTAEAQLSYESGATIRTETYMEDTFSLGTCSRPMCGGDQTASLFITYRRRPEMLDWRDASTAFVRYATDDAVMGVKAKSADGAFQDERFLPNQGWLYTAQKNNIALLLSIPNLRSAPIVSSKLQLSLVFPTHFGRIKATVIGDGPVEHGATGESRDVAPVSIEAGEVYIHIRPLIPTNLQRRCAVRFSRQNEYEVLELINYEGESRVFDRLELSRILNGMVVTVEQKQKYASLLDFHREKSRERVVDYLFVGTRFFEYEGSDTWFRVALSTDTMGTMTELIDGLPRSTAILESNQIDPASLPFLGERSSPNFPFFPWEQLEIMEWANSWIIGSRGLPGEAPYSRRVEALVPEPDGPRRSMFPKHVEKEENRRKLEAQLTGSPT